MKTVAFLGYTKEMDAQVKLALSVHHASVQLALTTHLICMEEIWHNSKYLIR